MKKIYTLSLAGAMVLVLTFTGCKKDATTSTTAQFSFAMGSDNATTPIAASVNSGSLTTFAVATGTASVAWTTAIANVSLFKLDAKKDGAAFEVTASGLANIDLLAITPAAINAVVPAGSYTSVELHVVLAKTTGTAFPLVLKGNYTTKAGTVVPIEFDFNDDAEIVAVAADMVIDGKSDLVGNISLHLNKLLADVTATDIDQTTRTNNTILITSAINPTVYAKIKADLLLAGGSNVVATAKK